MSILLNENATFRASVDAGMVSIIGTAIAGLLPLLAVLLPIVYYCFQIWETKTVQGWLERHRARKHAKKHPHGS